MPYITFTEYPSEPGRQYADVVRDPGTGAYVAVVDAVLNGETEITQAAHASAKSAADSYAASHPAVSAPDSPDASDNLAAGLAAIDTTAIADPAAKKAIDDVLGVLIGTKTGAKVAAIPA